MQVPKHYFDFFDLPVAFNVDQTLLRSKFLENSRKYHPDFHTLASASDQVAALDWSTYNNDAYKTLSDPDKRIHYVLKIKGMLEEEGAGNEKLPQSFLMDVMEVNEKIMELEFDPSPELYKESIEYINRLQTELNEQIGTVISDWNETSGTAEGLVAAKDYFLKKRYLLRVKENLSKFASAFG